LLFFSLFVMPMTVFDQVAAEELVEKLEPDLAYLFDEMDVPINVQANIAHRKITKLGVFAKSAHPRARFRWSSTSGNELRRAAGGTGRA
jgi:hypothetical protein